MDLPASPTYPLPEDKDPLPTPAPFPSLFSLASKTIAITGGGRGLGITFALAVVEAGGNAACLDILPEPSPVEWAHLSKLASGRGLSVTYHRCDVTDEEATRRVLEHVDAEAEARGAPFTGTVVCAGIQQKVPALEYPVADFERIQRVNVVGTFVTSKVSANIMVRNGRKGSIVLIASMSGQIANRVSTSMRFEMGMSTLTWSVAGSDVFGVQHEQGRRPADVQVPVPGMGPVRHQGQHPVARCELRRL